MGLVYLDDYPCEESGVPVKINMNATTSNALLQKLGVPDSAILFLTNQGVTLQSTSTTLEFTTYYNPHEVKVHTVTFKAGALSLLKKGILGNFATQHMASKVMEVVTSILAEDSSLIYEPLVEEAMEEFLNKTKGGSMDAICPSDIPDELPSNIEDVHSTSKGASVPPIDSGPLSGKVPLSKATKLYQSICGTTEGSEYFVVALHKDLVVAARQKKSKLSIRVESRNANINKYSAVLSKAGLDASSSKHYSMHLSVDDKVMARRVLGSVLMGIGVQFTSKMPSIEKIWNKGA